MQFLLGLILGLLVLPIAVFVYFRAGRPPVAVADQPFLLRTTDCGRAVADARIHSEMPQSAPH